MIVFTEPDHSRAKNGPMAQVKRFLRCVRRKPLCLPFTLAVREVTDIDHRQGNRQQWRDNLNRFLFCHRERGPQSFVSSDDLRKTFLQYTNIKWTFDTKSPWNVVNCAARLQLIQKP